jgi:lipoate-protein ligase A
VQDLGNINFSFLLPRALFTRSLGADIIVHALHRMGFPHAQVNDRGDLVLLSHGVSKKMSRFSGKMTKGERLI